MLNPQLSTKRLQPPVVSEGSLNHADIRRSNDILENHYIVGGRVRPRPVMKATNIPNRIVRAVFTLGDGSIYAVADAYEVPSTVNVGAGGISSDGKKYNSVKASGYTGVYLSSGYLVWRTDTGNVTKYFKVRDDGDLVTPVAGSPISLGLVSSISNGIGIYISAHKQVNNVSIGHREKFYQRYSYPLGAMSMGREMSSDINRSCDLSGIYSIKDALSKQDITMHITRNLVGTPASQCNDWWGVGFKVPTSNKDNVLTIDDIHSAFASVSTPVIYDVFPDGTDNTAYTDDLGLDAPTTTTSAEGFLAGAYYSYLSTINTNNVRAGFLTTDTLYSASGNLVLYQLQKNEYPKGSTDYTVASIPTLPVQTQVAINDIGSGVVPLYYTTESGNTSGVNNSGLGVTLPLGIQPNKHFLFMKFLVNTATENSQHISYEINGKVGNGILIPISLTDTPTDTSGETTVVTVIRSKVAGSYGSYVPVRLSLLCRATLDVSEKNNTRLNYSISTVGNQTLNRNVAKFLLSAVEGIYLRTENKASVNAIPSLYTLWNTCYNLSKYNQDKYVSFGGVNTHIKGVVSVVAGGRAYVTPPDVRTTAQKTTPISGLKDIVKDIKETDLLSTATIREGSNAVEFNQYSQVASNLLTTPAAQVFLPKLQTPYKSITDLPEYALHNTYALVGNDKFFTSFRFDGNIADDAEAPTHPILGIWYECPNWDSNTIDKHNDYAGVMAICNKSSLALRENMGITDRLVGDETSNNPTFLLGDEDNNNVTVVDTLVFGGRLYLLTNRGIDISSTKDYLTFFQESLLSPVENVEAYNIPAPNDSYIGLVAGDRQVVIFTRFNISIIEDTPDGRKELSPIHNIAILPIKPVVTNWGIVFVTPTGLVLLDKELGIQHLPRNLINFGEDGSDVVSLVSYPPTDSLFIALNNKIRVLRLFGSSEGVVDASWGSWVMSEAEYNSANTGKGDYAGSVDIVSLCIGGDKLYLTHKTTIAPFTYATKTLDLSVSNKSVEEKPYTTKLALPLNFNKENSFGDSREPQEQLVNYTLWAKLVVGDKIITNYSNGDTKVTEGTTDKKVRAYGELCNTNEVDSIVLETIGHKESIIDRCEIDVISSSSYNKENPEGG